MGWRVAGIPQAAALWLLLVACAGLALAQPSKVSRGVAVPFVFDPRAVCDAPPCQHGGLCIRNGTCFCSRGYEGERCQYATCYPKCKNGGKCLRPGKCRCQPGYGGRYCHKVSCEGGCQNGGECISVNGLVKCLCASGWTGSRCQEAVCPQGCRNGATCVAPGICSCATGWVGGACHLASGESSSSSIPFEERRYQTVLTSSVMSFPTISSTDKLHSSRFFLGICQPGDTNNKQQVLPGP
ncbi:wnt inhibitory factor 1-like [Podarcis raffonei]|uniref:wnt inhibitory factor 1-like n=1 Tax=Podarcis raffonei TaxID=65483 RepID=UPI002329981C|nr:wnt inhibitory factor 1-like [Podarcis raffonei]